ncbi:MAG: histidine kinase [Arenimonas sp.]
MPDNATHFWLPDLCRLPRIAAALAAAELVVVLMAITPHPKGLWTLKEFIGTSGFALWLALIVAMLLCKGRGFIHRLPKTIGILCSISLPMVLAGIGALCVKQIDLGLGYGLLMPEVNTLHFISSIALMTGLITAIALRYFYMREQWQAQVQSHAKAQVDALQARIRPHFLFNSMNSIASLIRRDPVTAERAVEDLADLFRAALGACNGESTLGEEITLAERYLGIEALRLGDRIKTVWEIEPEVDRSMKMPRLILQPLLENAVIHGVSRLPEGGEIRILLKQTPKKLLFEIQNPAPPPRENESNNAHAQDSIAQRLRYRFGSNAHLQSEYKDGRYICRGECPLT